MGVWAIKQQPCFGYHYKTYNNQKQQIDSMNFHEYGIKLQERRDLKNVRNNSQNLCKPYYCFHPTPRTHVMQLHLHFHQLGFLPFPWIFS